MLGLLQRLVACAEEPARLLSIGEIGSCDTPDTVVPRRTKMLDVSDAGGEAICFSVVGTGTRDIRLARASTEAPFWSLAVVGALR